MIAGTLAVLEDTADEPLESWFRGKSSLPALEVKKTQSSFDDRPIQSGVAADAVTRETKVPEVTVTIDGEPSGITEEPREQGERISTDWVADVTGTGLIAIESVDGDGMLDFPLDLFYNLAGSKPVRQRVDIEALHIAWSDEDSLGDVWLNAADGGDGARIDYHQQADPEQKATIGLGFERPWNGTVMRGVVYESGYCAVYNCSRPTEFVRFVEEELLPFCDDDDGDAAQQLLGQSGDQSDDSDDSEECDRCGRDADLSDYDGGRYCAVCIDYFEDEETGEGTDLDDLNTVNVTDGGDDDA